MHTPGALLRVIGKGLLNVAGAGLAGELLADFLPEVAQDVWAWWRRDRTPEQQREELQALANATPAEVEQAVQDAVLAVAFDQPAEVQKGLTRYLAQVPAAIRQSLRRPADPDGLSLPFFLSFKEPDDLLPLLPSRAPRFQPGDRPLPGIDWELVEQLGSGGFGEVWKARNPHFDGVPPVALKFCLDPAAKDRLLRHEAAVLNQLMRQGRHPGIVTLQHTYLSADPPCLEYEFVAGGDLTGVIREWHQQPPSPEMADRAARLMLDLARIVAFAHHLNPPIVHRDLKPANILLVSGGVVSGKGADTTHHAPRTTHQLKITDFGIGGVAASHAIARTRPSVSQGQFLVTALRGAHTPLYASPQQMRGAPPDPRDDVHALGVIWHQLVTGNLVAGRPGGARWSKRLSDLGMSAGMIELLGACVEEDSADRPADAADLAGRLAALLGDDTPARLAPDLADQVQRTLRQVEQAHAEARSLSEQAHDFAAAARLLDTVPEHLRDAGLYRRVCQLRDRVLALDRIIREAVHAARLDGLRPQIEELLRLQPQRLDLVRLLDVLPRGPDLAKLPRTITNSLGMKLTLIHPGSFLMGSPGAETGRGADEGPQHDVTLPIALWRRLRRGRGADEGPQHDVTLTQPFYLGVYPVTQREYEAVIGRNPAHFTKSNGGGPAHPVEQVSWDEAVRFCRGLSLLTAEKQAGRDYRLPTEAEWEFACRAGTTTAFAVGENLGSEMANFDGSRPHGVSRQGPFLQRTSKVGAYRPNAWGLHDMHGNVWEWCADWYQEGYYEESPAADPRGPAHGEHRVLRGGSWNNSGHLCRSARRNKYPADFRSDTIGFRVAMAAIW
jgi:formylglycine-generating enzyme required for sulfatase activity/serine/threonine protein kinase